MEVVPEKLAFPSAVTLEIPWGLFPRFFLNSHRILGESLRKLRLFSAGSRDCFAQEASDHDSGMKPLWVAILFKTLFKNVL